MSVLLLELEDLDLDRPQGKQYFLEILEIVAGRIEMLGTMDRDVT